VLIETSIAAKSEDLQKALHVYLLPKKSADQDAEADEKKWAGPKKIDEEVFKKAGCCRSSSSRPARKTPTCTVSGSASKPTTSSS